MDNIQIIKLGGSVLSRQDKIIDFKYLLNLRGILEEEVKNGKKFCIVSGGGFVSRKYRDLAKEEGGITNVQDLHWIGTTTNVFHAELIRTIFSDVAEARPFMYDDYYKEGDFEMTKPFLIGGGGRPGHSGDVDAIMLARRVGAKKILSLKNIDYLYSADPNKDKTATIIKHATWDEYFEILGGKKEHEPGGNYIVDPIAARLAKENKIKFIIMKGENLENLKSYLKTGEFVGSIISN